MHMSVGSYSASQIPQLKCESESRSVMSDSLLLYGLYSPWNSLGQNTGVGSLSFLHGIFPTQGSNPGIPHSKPSIFWHSAFFMIQLSHPYMTTGKTIALTIWTFVGKIMYLLFNMLSRFVMGFSRGSVGKNPPATWQIWV